MSLKRHRRKLKVGQQVDDVSKRTGNDGFDLGDFKYVGDTGNGDSVWIGADRYQWNPDGVKVKAVSTLYEFRNDKNEVVYVKKGSNGGITVENEMRGLTFSFINSDTKRLRRIAQLLVKAADALE